VQFFVISFPLDSEDWYYYCRAMNQYKNIGAIILAGGLSTRMGKDKAALLVNGQMLVYRLKLMLESIGLTVVISSDKFGVPDIYPQKGPLGGCYSGLLALAKTSTTQTVIMPVDMVHMTSSVIVTLLEHVMKSKNDERPFRFNNRHFPLFINNSENVRGWLKQTLECETGMACSMYALMQEFDCQTIDFDSPNPSVFDNVNTPSQWNQAFKYIMAH